MTTTVGAYDDGGEWAIPAQEVCWWLAVHLQPVVMAVES